ncbi:hypothetical protein BDC45DRAFT_569861 [Circinella umbellata]|nr:hypothetical protein BDC45DRAFT_569861 [Circinella umbellata]
MSLISSSSVMGVRWRALDPELLSGPEGGGGQPISIMLDEVLNQCIAGDLILGVGDDQYFVFMANKVHQWVFMQNGFSSIGMSKSIDLGTPPNNSNHENWELANKFHEYKEAVIEKEKTGILRLKSNPHEILVLTHVLLTQKTYVHLQIKNIGDEVLNNPYNDFVDELMDINRRLKQVGVKRKKIIPALFAKIMTKKFRSFEYCLLRSLQNMYSEPPLIPSLHTPFLV